MFINPFWFVSFLMRSDDSETYRQYGPPVEELLSGFSMASQGPVLTMTGVAMKTTHAKEAQITVYPTIDPKKIGDGVIIDDSSHPRIIHSCPTIPKNSPYSPNGRYHGAHPKA